MSHFYLRDLGRKALKRLVKDHNLGVSVRKIMSDDSVRLGIQIAWNHNHCPLEKMSAEEIQTIRFYMGIPHRVRKSKSDTVREIESRWIGIRIDENLRWPLDVSLRPKISSLRPNINMENVEYLYPSQHTLGHSPRGGQLISSSLAIS